MSEARKRTQKIRRISILKKVARNADEGQWHIRKKQNILTRKKGDNIIRKAMEIWTFWKGRNESVNSYIEGYVKIDFKRREKKQEAIYYL